jgi:hypothetical protein
MRPLNADKGKAQHAEPKPCSECRHIMGQGICTLVDDEYPLALRTVTFQRSSGFLRDCGPGGVFWEPRT